MVRTLSDMLSWIVSKAKGVTMHHLEGVGATVAASIMIFYAAEMYTKRKKLAGLVPHYSRSQSLGALHGGKMAVQRILEAQHARVDPSVLQGAERELTDLLAKMPLDFFKLQVPPFLYLIHRCFNIGSISYRNNIFLTSLSL